LMELAIIEFDSVVGLCPVGPSKDKLSEESRLFSAGNSPFLQDQLVIQSEFTFRCAAQIRPHHNLSIHICP
jgi:hypothetical protein